MIAAAAISSSPTMRASTAPPPKEREGGGVGSAATGLLGGSPYILSAGARTAREPRVTAPLEPEMIVREALLY